MAPSRSTSPKASAALKTRSPCHGYGWHTHRSRFTGRSPEWCARCWRTERRVCEGRACWRCPGIDRLVAGGPDDGTRTIRRASMESSPAARSKQGLEARRQMRVITDLVTIKAAASETGGAYALYETETPVSGGVPPHRQRYDDEWVYVLEWRYLFLVEGDEFEFGPGAFVHV